MTTDRSQNFEEISKYYAEYYANCLSLHDVFFIYKIPEEIRIWWANLLANVVIDQEKLWQNGRELWRPAGSLFLNMVNEKIIVFKRPCLIKRIISKSDRTKFIFPESTIEIKLAIEEMAKKYLEDPQNSQFDYEIELTG